MAAQQEVSIIINVETGKARSEVTDLSGSFEGLEASADQSLGSLHRRLEQTEGAAVEAGSGVKRFERAATRGAETIESGMMQVEAQMQDTAGATQRLARRASSTGGAMRSAGGGAADFDQAVMELGSTAQDAQYGLQGVGNNIGFLAEQFSQGYQQAGGFKAAMQGIGASLMGAGGVVLAIQALVTLGPKLISFFEEAGGKADLLAEKMEEVASDLVDLQAEIDSVSLSVSGEEEIRAYANDLEKAKRRQQAFVEALEGGADQGYFSDFFDALVQIGDVASHQEKAQALVQEPGVSSRTAKRALQQQAAAVKKVTEAAKDAGVDLQQQARTLKGLRSASESAKNKLAALTVTQEAQRAAMAAGAQRTKDYVKAIARSEAPLQAAREGLRKLTQMQTERDFPELRALAGEAQYLEQALDALADDTQVNMQSTGVQALRQKLKAVREELSALKEEGGEGGDDPASPLLQKLRSEYEATRRTLARKVELGQLSGGEAIQRRLEVLRGQLDQVAADHTISLRAEGVERIQQRIQRLQQKLLEARDKLQKRSAAGRPAPPTPQQKTPDQIKRPDKGNAFDKAMGDLKGLERQVKAGVVPATQAASKKVSILEGAVQKMAAAGKAGSKKFETLQEALKNAQQQAQADWGTKALSAFQQNAGQVAQRVGQIFKAMHQRRLRQIRREKQERIRSINEAEKRKLASIDERIDAAAEGSKKQEQLMEKRQNLRQDYDDEREKARQEAQKKKAKAKRKQAKMDKATALFEIGVNTASAVAEALPNIPLSVAVGVMGAAQAAAVLAKPLPEVPEFAAGAVRLTPEGVVEGPGGPREDRVPARLEGAPIRVSAGESIINAASTEAAPRALEEVNASPERARRVERVVAEEVTPKAMRVGYADGAVSIERALTNHPVPARLEETPIRVSAGESIVNADSTEAAPQALRLINTGGQEARRVETLVTQRAAEPQRFAKGGVVGGAVEARLPDELAAGGLVRGPGGPREDAVPARLSDGEFVVNAESASAAPKVVERMNAAPRFAAAMERAWLNAPANEERPVFAEGGRVQRGIERAKALRRAGGPGRGGGGSDSAATMEALRGVQDSIERQTQKLDEQKRRLEEQTERLEAVERTAKVDPGQAREALDRHDADQAYTGH